MKKQWLSIVLVLCMVLCMAPTTARAAEGETGTLKITVDLSGLYDGVDAGGKTFSFEILRKYANYGHYKNADITIKSGETAGTVDVPVEAGKYVVKQISHATIDGYDWENASHQPGNNIESNEQEVFADKTKSVTVHNFYKLAVTKEITELPITVTGYALGAKVGDIKASTDQMRVDIHKVTIKQRNASGGWDDLASDATIQANTQYAVEIFVNAKPEYTYTGLTKDKVTVNGKEASVFENPSTQSGGDMRVFYELEVLEVVKTVESIEITTPPAKTEYMVGEDFDPTGMVVTAHYTDGTTADLSRDKYVIFYGDKLALGRASVTIQYNDGSGGSNIKTYQAITVKPYVGPHTYGGPWYADAKSHWHQCTDSACPDPSGSTKDLASHTFVWKVDKAATETQTGLKHEECTVCGHKRSENTEIPLLTGTGVTTYPITVMSGKNGGVTASHKSAAKGALVTLTVTPDKGYALETLNVLDQNGKALPLTQQNGKYGFTMPASAVTVKATFMDDNTMLNFFVDVSASDYYYDAVLWAVGKGITGGTSATTFDPSGNCTRAHAVTFLWRAAGSPAPKTKVMPFTDVPAGSYYHDAVLWAMEQGITKGTSDTAFSPNPTCPRAQIVPFLWRSQKSPAAGTANPFTDVKASAYYADAVLWAVKEDVTKGTTNTTFSPDANCTRAQIVTFIWRALAE